MNTSGSTIFRGNTAVDEEVAEANEVKPVAKRLKVEYNNTMEQVEVKDIELNGNGVNTVSGGNNERNLLPADSAVDYDEDDIELHIKRSVMVRNPFAVNKKKRHDHNQNNASTSDEFNDFKDGPTRECNKQQPLVDLCSMTSEEQAEVMAGEETAEELNTEEEDVDEQFVDLTREIERFPGSEIIVLSDTELNSSIASDITSEDPLAIDDFTHPLPRDSANPLDSSTNDEASTSATDLLWINIDDGMKSKHIKAITPNSENSSQKTDASPLPTPTETVAIKTTHEDVATSTAEAEEEKTHITNKSNTNDEHTEELRSDGSDSGLGSETSTLQTTLASIADTSQLTENATPTPTQTPTQDKTKPTVTCNTMALTVVDGPQARPSIKKPLRSNLKRRLNADEDALVEAGGAVGGIVASQQKKLKRSINFDNVQVYYFPRQQGFGCVPSAGGCTLGMGSRHVATKTLTLAEHAAEIRRAHRLQLQDNPRGSSSDDSEESEEDYLSEGSGSDLDAESNGFLQPVSPKQRRALLKAAGVRKIDASEKAECRDIRNSREVCGCTCRDFCDPETCACSLAGIKCQVDRAMFPCGCSRDACGNSVGRVEFNPARVRTHFIHTIMRLEMENRQQHNPLPHCYGMSATAASSATLISAQTGSASLVTSNYYSMQQSQSNYSSGYASPAYPAAEQTATYYQQQNAHYSQDILQPTAVATASSSATNAQYQLDSLDANLFTGAATATPSYGELMPSYGSVSTTAAFHNVNYGAVHGTSLQTQVSTYASYHHQTAASYLPTSHQTPSPSGYSSCAVPSVPPFGTATTTAASPQYLNHSSTSVAALESNAASCLTTASTNVSTTAATIDGGGAGGSDTNFISLTTPISSSSRISQINDLLQHNRNTTAALVAVAQCPLAASISSTSSLSAAMTNATTATATTPSIDTPPMEDVQRNCLNFEELRAPLNPTPIVAVLEESAASCKLPEIVVTTTPIATIATTATATTPTLPTARASLHSEDDEDVTESELDTVPTEQPMEAAIAPAIAEEVTVSDKTSTDSNNSN